MRIQQDRTVRGGLLLQLRKAYCRGTYLEDNFYSENGRLSTAEEKYTGLMYRTPLEKKLGPALFSGKLEAAYTSQVLASYEKGVTDWAESWGYVNRDGILTTEMTCKGTFYDTDQGLGIAVQNYRTWLKAVEKSLEKVSSPSEILKNQELTALLPAMAWIGKNQKTSGNTGIFELLKLAYSLATRYTIIYESIYKSNN